MHFPTNELLKLMIMIDFLSIDSSCNWLVKFAVSEALAWIAVGLTHCLVYIRLLLLLLRTSMLNVSYALLVSHHSCHISKVTGHHRGPKPKLRAGYRALSLKRTSHVATRFHRREWYRALSLRYACIRRSGIILIP